MFSSVEISKFVVFEDKNFSMTVIGNVDVGVEFTSATNLGTVIAGIPSLVSLEATTVEENRVLEYVDHLHEHFVDPVKMQDGHYMPPTEPGYSITMKQESIKKFRYPDGLAWRE